MILLDLLHVKAILDHYIMKCIELPFQRVLHIIRHVTEPFSGKKDLNSLPHSPEY